MAINVSGILKSPQGSAIQNAEIIFEQTRTSTEVLAGTKFSIITNQTGNYSSSLGVGTYTFKVRFQDETQYRTVASNVIVTQSMDNYSLNQIIQVQSQMQDVDYDLLQDVIQARNQAAESAQAAQNSQATATTKASEASSSAQAALASKNAAQTSEANALSSKNAAQTSQTNAASSQTAAANSQTAAANSQTTATTKATEASSSAQAALTSKNAAQTSETNALASKNAAQTSQTNASTKASEAATSQTTATTKASQAASSQTQAQQSQSDAGAAASQADNSAQQAQQSQTSASTSQATATTKASEASSSAQAALASKNAAQTSETNALSSKNAAQTSQTNAAGSQTAASTSQTTASTKAGEASTSQTTAAASQTTATTKAGEASTSQTNAATSQATATTKAGEASTSQTNAASSQSTATTKATEATNSATLAQKWAANPENSAVSGGLYSALHYAAKAAQSAQTASGQLVWRGGWSAQAGSAPPTPSGATQDFYRITQAGTILSVQYEVGDYIHWDNLNSIWFKMDGTDSVTSVNGRTGAVVVTKTDVGLSAVNNWGASSQTNNASTTTYATTAGVKAAYDLAATKLTATANAVSATKLVTARTINGTSFDGTANITTQNWGTSRNLTIGETSKAVNGSADVSWTLDEIGAIPATLLPTGSNYQDVVSKLIRVGSDGVQKVGRILDFHAENSTLDNDVRFTVTNETGTISRGDLEITARTVRVNGNEVYHQGNTSPVALGAVPDTRTVNGKRLNADVTLVPQDLGTLTTSEIEALGRKSIIINQPAGLVQGKYYPIVVTNYYNDQALYITTRSSVGSDPMNNCSFDGIVRQAGWSDKSSIVDGVFTAYSSSERAIHSIVGPSEQEGVYAIYVEARQFPIVLRVQGSQTVKCTGAAISHDTSTFVAQVDNPSDITGSTNKLNMLADFAKGSGRYRGGSLYYHEGYLPTPDTLGAVPQARTINSKPLTSNITLSAADVGALPSSSYNPRADSLNNSAGQIGAVEAGDMDTRPAGDFALFNGNTVQNSPPNTTYFYCETKSIYNIGALLQTAWPYDGGGGVYHRNYSLNTRSWTPWQRVYDTKNKPTASDVGAVPATGGTVFGALGVTAELNLVANSADDMADIVWRAPDSTERGRLWIGGTIGADNSLTWRSGGSGATHKIYHEGNKPTASDVGAMADGGFYGTIHFSNWVRTTGDTGWFNATYGGGIYMGDTTWIRIYNGKKFHIANGEGDALNVAGGIYAGGNGNFGDVYIRSDKRLKTNLVPLSDALEKVCKLTGYEYDKKKCLSATEYDVHEAGLIAQDVQAVLPAATSEVNSATASGNEENVLTISHGGVIALLVEAVKELSEKVKELEYGRT